MTPDQIIQAIEPWIEIANAVITLYWAVVILPALGCSAAVYAVIAGERWINDGYLPGAGCQPRGKDTGVRNPPRGGCGGIRGKGSIDLTKVRLPTAPSAVHRSEDRYLVRGTAAKELKVLLAEALRKSDRELRVDPDPLSPDRVRR